MTAPYGANVYCCGCGKHYAVEPSRCECGCLGFQHRRPESASGAEPSPELVEEIAMVLAKNMIGGMEQFRIVARAVLSSPSIAWALEESQMRDIAEKYGLDPVAEFNAEHGVTPQATGLSAIAQTRDGWMPIASAPRDGSDVLCWSHGLFIGAMVLYWMDGYWREKANCQGLKRDPDYWMPLPSPPVERSEIGEVPVKRAVND